MKFLQTVYEKINSLFGNDPFESWWNQRKYQKFSELLPQGDHKFGQFRIGCTGRSFDVWFKDVELLYSESAFDFAAIFGIRRKYSWNCTGAFQQDFINFIDEWFKPREDFKYTCDIVTTPVGRGFIASALRNFRKNFIAELQS